jgi:general secretion pathway protein H
MTLVEILVVMGIIVLVMGGVVLGSGQLASARLKQSAALVTSAVKTAYAQANANSKSMRLAFDLEENKMWLEVSDSPMLVQTKDASGTGGADPVTAAEQASTAEGERIVKGPRAPRPQFHAVASEAGQISDRTVDPTAVGRKLSRGIHFRSIQCQHDDQPRTSGRAYLYFWSGGQTERCAIQIAIGDEKEESSVLTLMVSPLTGKVTMKPGAVALQLPTDDAAASEREERTTF